MINLSLTKTSADWLKVPGIKGAWKNVGSYGKVVLQDIDHDGQWELYGTAGGTSGNRKPFSCRLANGELAWTTPDVGCAHDNNGVWVEDIDGDGKYEAVDVGCYISVLDAAGVKIVFGERT